MKVEKRNALAETACLSVPLAISELQTAEQDIRDGKPNEALKWLAEARIHLEHLRVAFEEACKEIKAEPQ